MKNYYRLILLAFLVLIVITASSVYRYISCLKAQNNILVNNISPIMKRIALLEADKTMEKITVLKRENTTLKKQVEDLKVELKQISQECSKSSNQHDPAP